MNEIEQEEKRQIGIEIHRKAKNVEDSTTYEPCDNGNNDLKRAYEIAAAMWRDKDPIVSSFPTREDLMDTVKQTLDSLPPLDVVNENHFARF